MEYDYLIKNATVVEGTGRKSYKGSLAVKGDKIVETGDVKGDAAETIDAKGLTAVPGFIDAHTPSWAASAAEARRPSASTYRCRGFSRIIWWTLSLTSTTPGRLGTSWSR